MLTTHAQVFPDWFNANVEQWWTENMQDWFNSGVKFDGIWLDMNGTYASLVCGSAPNAQHRSTSRPALHRQYTDNSVVSGG